MTPDELAAMRELELARSRTLRSALVPHLFVQDEKQRQRAGRLLRRIDARIRRLGGTREEIPEAGPRRYLLY